MPFVTPKDLTHVQETNVEAKQEEALNILLQIHKTNPEALPFVETMNLGSEGDEGGEDPNSRLPIIALRDVNNLAFRMMVGRWVDMFATYKQPYLEALISYFETTEEYEYCGQIAAAIKEWVDFNNSLE